MLDVTTVEAPVMPPPDAAEVRPPVPGEPAPPSVGDAPPRDAAESAPDGDDAGAPEGEAPPSVPEQPRSAEITPETRAQEVDAAAGALLGQKMKHLKESGVPTSDRGRRALASVQQLDKQGEGSYVDPSDPEFEKGINLTGKKPDGTPYGDNPVALVLDDGRKVKINYVQGGTADTFTCMVEANDGSGFAITLPREAVMRAQLLAESDAILAMISDDPQNPERAILETFFKKEQGDMSLVTNPNSGQAIDEMLPQVAREQGLLTTEDVRSFATAILGRGSDAAAAEAQFAEINTLLQGRNIVDSETFAKVAEKLGLSEEDVTAVGQYLEKVASGAVVPGKGIRVAEALKEGDIEKVKQATEKALGERGDFEVIPEMAIADKLIDGEMAALHRLRSRLKAEKKDIDPHTGMTLEDIDKKLGVFALAKEINGEFGILYKYGVLKTVRFQGLQIQQMEQVYKATDKKIDALTGQLVRDGMSTENISQLVATIERGDMVELIESGLLDNFQNDPAAEDLDVKFWGKKMKQDEIDALAEQYLTEDQKSYLRKNKKQISIGLLSILVIAAQKALEPINPIPSSQGRGY